MTAVMGILVFILLVLLMWYLMRWLSRKGFGGGRSKHMEVLDRLAVSRESCILILRVAGRVFAVSSGRDSSSLICELDASELMFKNEARPGKVFQGGGSSQARSGFWKRFLHNMKLNMGLLPKGAKPMTPSGDGTFSKEESKSFKDIFDSVRHSPAETASTSRPPETGIETQEWRHISTDLRDKADRPSAANYKEIIENMQRLGRLGGSETQDSIPATMHEPGPESYPIPESKTDGAEIPDPPSEAAEPDKYDVMFDLIARRQSRYAGGKDRGKGAQ